MTRDYVSEMRALIDAEDQAGEPRPVLAARLVEKLRTTDPGLLAGWLDVAAVHFLRDWIGHLDRCTRSYARGNESRGAFADAARHFEHRVGESDDVLSPWLDSRYTVNPEGGRLTLRHMRAEHLLFVETDYAAGEKSLRFERMFIAALRSRVGASSVGEVFTEEQIAAMRKGIT